MDLGIALAQPELHAIVVTGDGEALMGMGALATVGAIQPPNPTIVVFDNEHYGETGMQQSHLGMGVDLCAVAVACGLKQSCTITTEAELQSVMRRFHALGTPKLVLVKIDPETPPRVMPTRDGAEKKSRFVRHSACRYEDANLPVPFKIIRKHPAVAGYGRPRTHVPSQSVSACALLSKNAAAPCRRPSICTPASTDRRRTGRVPPT